MMIFKKEERDEGITINYEAGVKSGICGRR